MKNDKCEELVRETAEALNTEPEQLAAVIAKFKKDTEEMEKETAVLERQLK